MSSRSSMGLLLLCAALAAAACGQGPTDAPAGTPRTSQLLVTIEAIAPAHLSLYGGPRAMPKLAALASSGTVFDDAMTTSPVARPALVSILTGVSTDRSGVRDSIHDAVGGDTPTLAEGAKKAGFETAAFVSSPFASYSSGLQRGFDLFDGPDSVTIGPGQYFPPVVPASKVADHFKAWASTRGKGKPFFAWVHFADLNGLATPPPGSVGATVKKSGDPLEDYDRELGSIDEAIGAIVESLKREPAMADCAVTIVGTHGAYLGGTGRRGDVYWLADETLRIPVVRVPGLPPGSAGQARHDPRPTWLPDVTASLATATGATVGKGADGVPLEQAPASDRVRRAWTFAPDDQLAWPPLTAVKIGNVLSVFEGGDDGRLRPVGGASESAMTIARERPAVPRRRLLTEELRSRIAKTGLKIGTKTIPQTPPANSDVWLNDLQVARRFAGMPRPSLTMRWTKRLLLDAPDALAAILTRMYFLAGEPSDELSEIRDKLLALYPDRSDVLHWSAHVSLLPRDYVRATALLDAAIAVGPVEPEMYYDRACIEFQLGHTKAGLDALETALTSGFRNWDWMDKDPDLADVRKNPDFIALLRAHGR